jgi:hypothetical protein
VANLPMICTSQAAPAEHQPLDASTCHWPLTWAHGVSCR